MSEKTYSLLAFFYIAVLIFLILTLGLRKYPSSAEIMKHRQMESAIKKCQSEMLVAPNRTMSRKEICVYCHKKYLK